MKSFLLVFSLAFSCFTTKLVAVESDSFLMIQNWLEGDSTKQNLMEARQTILEGQGLEKGLDSLNIPMRSELYQALFQEPLDGVVLHFLELLSSGLIKEAVSLYDSILVPAYHFRFFLHTVLQGTPLNEALAHFKNLDPFLKRALLDEEDREQICHYARVRMGLRNDPSAFFKLKGVRQSFEKAYLMVENNKPLKEAVRPLLNHSDSFRYHVLTREESRAEIADYLRSARKGNAEDEKEKWLTLVLLWASGEALKEGDLLAIQSKVGLFSPSTALGLAFNKGTHKEVALLYRAMASRRFQIAPQLFHMNLSMKNALKAVERLKAGEGVAVVLESQFGMDARFPIYRILGQEAYREEILVFYQSLSSGEGFYASFEQLASLTSYVVPKPMMGELDRSPVELASFRSIYQQELVERVLPPRKAPNVPKSVGVLLPTNPLTDTPVVNTEEGPLLSQAGRFLNLEMAMAPVKEVTPKKEDRPDQLHTPSRQGISLGPVGPFPPKEIEEEPAKPKGYRRLLSKLMDTFNRLR